MNKFTDIEVQEDITFYQWLDTWLSVFKAAEVKPQTLKTLKYFVDIAERYIADIKLGEVNCITCQAALNNMAKNQYSKASIAKVKCIFNQSLRTASKQRYIPFNPADELIVPIWAPTKEVQALTVAEQAEVERCTKYHEKGEYILFLLDTGLRRQEFVDLKWSDFDAFRREIKIRKSKTKSGIRTVPLISRAYCIIMKQPHIDEYIFHNAYDDKRITANAIRRLTERISIETGIDAFSPHVCRHTFATRLIEKGADPKSVAALLGHKRVEYTLNIYTTITNERLKNQIFLLEKVG